jgi:hypothetical protein
MRRQAFQTSRRMSEPLRQCRACNHFRNDAKYLETVFKGLTSLGSGYGSVRSDDGVCLRHDRYLSARSSCADFVPSTSHPIAKQP